MSKLNRRGLLGLFAGAAVSPYLPKVPVKPSLGASYSLDLDVNGHVTGFKLSQGSTQSFVVVADSFGFITPGKNVVRPLVYRDRDRIRIAR